MSSFYSCVAFIYPGVAIVTTNDAEYYNRLVELGGDVVCHPNLFDSNRQQEELGCLSQSVLQPYVVQIPRDKLAAIQSVPTDKYESYETRLYR